MPQTHASTVLLVPPDRSEIYQQVIDSAVSVLTRDDPATHKISVELAEGTRQELAERVHRAAPDLLVAIGKRAALRVREATPQIPTLFTLIPRQTYYAITGDCYPRECISSSRTASGIFLDQPLERQLDLIRLAFPQVRRVGVLYGPTSWKEHADLTRLARRRQLRIPFAVVREERELNMQLARLLEQSEVLLSLPDTLVFNSKSAQPLLLLTYLQTVPVIGFSSAYVAAGATLAVHSTASQIGTQIGEVVLGVLGTPGMALPAPRYPKYFTVSVNRRVADSLGLAVPSEDRLTAELEHKREQSD